MTSTPKLKIGFVLDDGLDRPDGVQQNILTLGEWLKTQGHEVHYLVGKTTRTDIENVYSIARNIQVRFNGNKLTIPLYAPKKNIKKILSREQFDVLHVQIPYHPFCAARVVKAANSKTAIVGTFHVLEYGLSMRYGTRLLGLYLHRNLKQFDRFMSVSEPARQFAKQSFRIDSTVLPNPVEAAKFRPKKPKKHDLQLIRFVFLGRLVPRKGCMKLLEAIRLITQSSSVKRDFHVDICGDGALRTSLKEYVQRHGLDDKVTFHGFVSEEQKVDLLQRADIAVYPSSGGESFGIVLVEAMAADNLVLAGDNPGYRSVMASVPDSLFDPRSAEELSAKLTAYMTSREQYTALHAKQRQLFKQFDVAVVGGRLLDIYRDCIAEKNGR